MPDIADAYTEGRNDEQAARDRARGRRLVAGTLGAGTLVLFLVSVHVAGPQVGLDAWASMVALAIGVAVLGWATGTAAFDAGYENGRRDNQ